MRITARLAILVLAAVAAIGCSDDVLAPHARANVAPVIMADAAGAIEDRWIVVLHDDVVAARGVAASMVSRSGGHVGVSFGGALRGFTAELTADEVERMRRDPAVAWIEQDAVVRITGTTDLPWNLARIGRTPLPAGVGATGAGVHAYVIDTGIRTTHSEFGRRAIDGFDALDGGAGDDCNGHGTHVAGTIGGATRGVAPGASLVSVRVLDCGGTGTLSSVIAGIDWVVANHVKPAVANLSIAGAASPAVDAAVERAIAAGIVFVVAAGNDGRNACDSSPARAPAAITVGATTPADVVWALSNQGACVDLFAPGVDIVSAARSSDDAYAGMSGTSMAAPHAAGAAALRLEREPGESPAQVAAALRDGAVRGELGGLSADSPDLLLQVRVVPSWRDLRDRAR